MSLRIKTLIGEGETLKLAVAKAEEELGRWLEQHADAIEINVEGISAQTGSSWVDGEYGGFALFWHAIHVTYQDFGKYIK
jgi:hypothetical protein